MQDPTGGHAEFWRAALLAGGFSAIPRWSLDPEPGIGTHEAAIPDDLVARLQRLSEDLALPLDSVLLAAHAKVLSALSGEQEVATGYIVDEGAEPLLCRLSTAFDSWRSLLSDVHRVESEILLHRDFPVDALARELGLTEPPFETVLDPTGGEGTLGADTVMWLGLSKIGKQPVLRLRYRTDVLDADCAARVVGYHLTALALIAADPEAAHENQSLLSPDELEFQLEGLAGPSRELPDRRVHELFEDRVRTHPDAIAAVHGDRQWTYRQLNAQANQLGRALVARGLHREGAARNNKMRHCEI